MNRFNLPGCELSQGRAAHCEEAHVSARREFVKLTMAASVSVGFGCGGGGSPTSPLAPPPPQGVTLRIPLMDVGASVAAFSGDFPLLVTRPTESSVIALSRVCTHMGCTVLLPGAAGTLDCPCHGSRYTLGGAVVNGPASRALPSFPARIEGAEVVITFPG
jgi:cytochrome b6-f complex iron-sulfur subunit